MRLLTGAFVDYVIEQVTLRLLVKNRLLLRWILLLNLCFSLRRLRGQSWESRLVTGPTVGDIFGQRLYALSVLADGRDAEAGEFVYILYAAACSAKSLYGFYVCGHESFPSFSLLNHFGVGRVGPYRTLIFDYSAIRGFFDFRVLLLTRFLLLSQFFLVFGHSRASPTAMSGGRLLFTRVFTRVFYEHV